MVGSSLMYSLADGNPGALTVVSKLNWVDLIALDKTMIRSSMIWVGFKDICKEDIKEFKKKLHNNTLQDAVMKTPDWKYLYG